MKKFRDLFESREARALDAIKRFRERQQKEPGFGSGNSFQHAVSQVADEDIRDAVSHGIVHGTNTPGFKDKLKS